MAQATVNRVTYRTIKEATPGTTPASPVLTSIRFTQGGPQGTPQFVESGEVVSDRMTNDIVYVGKEIGGDIGGELSYECAPDLLDSAMCNSRVQTPNRVGTQISTIAAATDYPVSAASGGNGTPAQYQMWRATGFTSAANNKIFVALTGTTGTTIKTTGLTTEAVPASARLRCIGYQAPSGTIAAAITPTRLTDSGSLFVSIGCFTVGQWVKIGGATAPNLFATTPANNGWCRISALAAGTMTFDITPTGFGVDAGATRTICIFTGDFIYGGTSLVTFTIEREFADIARYEYFSGCASNTMQVQLQSKQIATVSFGVVGMGHTSLSASRFASATSRNGIVAPILSAASHVAQLRDNGTVVAGPNFITSLSFSVTNNIEGLPYVGSTDYAGLNMGEQKIEGQIAAYLGDETLLARVYAGTTMSLDMVLAAPDGSGYLSGMVIDLPKIKYSGGNPDVGGKNSVVTQTIPFRALKATPASVTYAIGVTLFEGVGSF